MTHHLPTLIACLLLVGCGGDPFSAQIDLTGGTASLDASGGSAQLGGAGQGDMGGDPSTGGTQNHPAGGSSAQGGSETAGSAGQGGEGGSDPEWIPDAECGPPLVDYSQLPTHFVWESFSATAGGECLYCLQSPCVEFEAEWDETFSKWTLWDESWPTGYAGGGELQLRVSSTTRLDDDGDTIQLGRSETCGDETPTDYCSCTASFGSEYNPTNNMFLVRTATGYKPDNKVFIGMSPESCSNITCPSATAERMELNGAAGTQMATVLSAQSDGIEFPCSGN